MHPDVQAITAAMSPEEINGLADAIAQQADARGVQLTPELIEASILGAAYNDEWTADGLGDHLEAAAYNGPAYEPTYEPAYEPTPAQQFGSDYLARRMVEDAEQRQLNAQATQAEEDALAFEQRLGRTMTDREATRLAQEQLAQVTRGGQLDVDQAASAAGVKSYEAMSHKEQAAAMVERAREMGGSHEHELEIPAVYTGNPDGPAYEPDFDNMSRKDTAAYMAARMGGASLEVEHEGYDGGEWE